MVCLSEFLLLLVLELRDESRLGNGWRAGELENWI